MKKALFTAIVLLILFTLTSCKKIQETQNPTDNDFLEKTETSISKEAESIPPTELPETVVSPTPKETNNVTVSPKPKATPESTISPIPKETNSAPPSTAPMPVPLRYVSKETFHNAVVTAKETVETNSGSRFVGTHKQNNGTSEKIEEITSYLDFTNIVNNVELFEISVMPVYVILKYRDKVESHEIPLLIEWDRGAYGDNYNYIEQARTRLARNPIEINYNGKTIIKSKVYWDDAYMSNQYYWVENGYNVHVVVPAWLLELYPEETFFDVQVVNIPG